ncbi:MAG: helix-turn-helix transcriptional regulator [Pseudomonadota bacterium]
MGKREAVLDVVDQLYAGAIRGDGWNPALGAMSELLSAVGVSFEVFDVKARAPLIFDYNARMPLPDKMEYTEYYSPRSPRLNANLRAAPGSISFDHMILSEDEMDRDEFYTDFMAPLDLRYFLSVQVLSSPSHQGVFALQRSKAQGHVGTEEIGLMTTLAPHLRHAAELRFRLADARHELQSRASGFDMLSEGCVTLLSSGAIKTTNSLAESLLIAGDGITVQRGALAFTDKDAHAQLRRCLLEIGEGGEAALAMSSRNFPAKRPSGKRPYLISVRPLPPVTEIVPHTDYGAAMVFIRDTDDFGRLDQELLAQSYGLSRSEAEIASEVDRGLSVGAIARKRGVAVTTIRTQLYALMAKMQVKRQTELVQLLGRYRLPFV